MEGVIDLIYRLDGHLWIADYKTDQVTAEEAPARAERYSQQAMLYRQAVAACLGTSSIAFQFLFLRITSYNVCYTKLLRIVFNKLSTIRSRSTVTPAIFPVVTGGIPFKRSLR